MYEDEELVVGQLYRSRDGQSLRAVGFHESARVRSGHGGYISWYWFGWDKEDAPRFIGGGLTLLEHADLNGDGKEEFVFWIDRYNENGYLIAWNRFRDTAEFAWTYH